MDLAPLGPVGHTSASSGLKTSWGDYGQTDEHAPVSHTSQWCSPLLKPGASSTGRPKSKSTGRCRSLPNIIFCRGTTGELMNCWSVRHHEVRDVFIPSLSGDSRRTLLVGLQGFGSVSPSCHLIGKQLFSFSSSPATDTFQWTSFDHGPSGLAQGLQTDKRPPSPISLPWFVPPDLERGMLPRIQKSSQPQ